MKLSSEEFSQKYLLKYEKVFEAVNRYTFRMIIIAGQNKMAVVDSLEKKQMLMSLASQGQTKTYIFFFLISYFKVLNNSHETNSINPFIYNFGVLYHKFSLILPLTLSSKPFCCCTSILEYLYPKSL